MMILKQSIAVAVVASGVVLVSPKAAVAASPTYAVWLDGNTSPTDGAGILTALTAAYGAGSYTVVSSAQLDTPGFLNAFQAIIVSRSNSGFGAFLDPTAAANVSAYVNGGSSQGGVALFTNDASDNFFGATGGDPYDANLNQLFLNATQYAAASGHGYIGEFNGAVQAMSSNSAGATPLNLITGSATAVGGYGPQFVYGVGPVGSGNPIDTGVTFPFTDSDDTTFLTQITGAPSGDIVDVYTSGDYINNDPAVLANGFVISGGNPNGGTPVPEPASVGLLGMAAAILGLVRRRRRG